MFQYIRDLINRESPASSKNCSLLIAVSGLIIFLFCVGFMKDHDTAITATIAGIVSIVTFHKEDKEDRQG